MPVWSYQEPGPRVEARPQREGSSKPMPQQIGEPDRRELQERYEKELHQLQTQIKFLEDETALLRRRLTNSPRQVKVLEEQLLQSRGELARAVSQNDKLVEVLRSE